MGTKVSVSSITSQLGNKALFNSNFSTLADAFDNVLSLDGTSPNQMSANIDMNSNKVINLATPVDPNDAARLADVSAVVAAGLPDQTGNSGKYLTTDGSTASWGTITSFLTAANNLSDVASASTALSNLGGLPLAGGTMTGDIVMSACSITLSKGADVASATALPLITDGNYFDVTGTTTVTSLDTMGIGTVVKLHFDGILTLTHHATNLILPGAANITTAAGDEFEFVEYASGNWRCTSYALASGSAISGGTGGGEEDAGGNIIGFANKTATAGDYTTAADENLVTAGPFTVSSGDTITITSGSTWTVV